MTRVSSEEVEGRCLIGYQRVYLPMRWGSRHPAFGHEQAILKTWLSTWFELSFVGQLSEYLLRIS